MPLFSISFCLFQMTFFTKPVALVLFRFFLVEVLMHERPTYYNDCKLFSNWFDHILFDIQVTYISKTVSWIFLKTINTAWKWFYLMSQETLMDRGANRSQELSDFNRDYKIFHVWWRVDQRSHLHVILRPYNDDVTCVQKKID